MICDLTVNYMEIQDFVNLPGISLMRLTWNDSENDLENCENILENILEKCLNFFSWKLVLAITRYDSYQTYSFIINFVLPR